MENVERKITMYLKAKILPYFIIFLKTENYLNYIIGNLLDPMPKTRKNETTENYISHLTPKQAVRFTRYFRTKLRIQNAPYRVERPDFSMYEEKSREVLERMIYTVFEMEDQWEEYFKDSLIRR